MLSTPSSFPSAYPAVRPASTRIVSIDALRGLVMLLMLVDHTREFFFYHQQVVDPMDLTSTGPALFFTRLTAHLCAPVFVALTGLSAWLYGTAHGGAAAASAFLVKRGLFLIVLEVTLVSFAWSFDPTPDILYLQVIWVIGLSMIALSALVHLPRWALIALGSVIVLGNNLLDGVTFAPGEAGYVPWAILHDRSMIDLPWGGRARTSYPLLAWIGVIALGYGIGPWFARAVEPARRTRLLIATGVIALAGFLALRTLNVYGDPHPWQAGDTTLATAMSFLNLTKYPPSADFVLATLGIGALLLVVLERARACVTTMLAVFGGAPLFFYLLHLYLLHGTNRLVGALTGASGWVSAPGAWALWLIAAAAALPCWFACRRFAAVKRASGRWWMRYL